MPGPLPTGHELLLSAKKQDVEEALRLFDRAIQADPKFATPYSARSFALAQMFIQGNADDLDACGTQAMADAEKALTLDDRDGFCHYALGRACTLAGQVDRAIPAHEKAVELQPNSAMFEYGLGFALTWFKRPLEAIPHLDAAVRLGPHDPLLWAFYNLRGNCRLFLKQFGQAITDYNLAIQFQGHQFYPHLYLAATFGYLGQRSEAEEAYDRAYQLRPDLRGVSVRDLLPHAELAELEEGLRKAGLQF